jgi:hypothetical protein
MPSGAGPGGGFLFSTVGRNRVDDETSPADGLDRIMVKATIMVAGSSTTATDVQTLLVRRGDGTTLTLFERRLMSWLSLYAPLVWGAHNMS